MSEFIRSVCRVGLAVLAAGCIAAGACGVAEAAPETAAAKKPAAKASGALKPAGKADRKPASGAGAAKAGAFDAFVTALWPDAQAAGISRAVFDDALRGVTPDPTIVALTRKQSEFVRPMSDYVAGAASAQRLARGRAAGEQWASTLDRVERASGVPREIVLAVWGMESGFGANTGGFYVVRALATLAFVRHRGDFFRDELVQALRILQQDHIARSAMKGSWAGAMGQTQFMPSSFLAYAVDGDGDGRRDIWTSVPDALASTANFLKEKGWQPGLPWVVEVALPGTLDFRDPRRGFAEWAAVGVKRTDGQDLPRTGNATLLMPTGVRGPAFLLGDNFQVIRAYNSSDAYALGVGYLAHRIAGGAPIARAWPTEKTLSQGEREEVQKRLARLGLYKGDADGRHGTITRDAIREFQTRTGLVADGYADFAVLKALREAK